MMARLAVLALAAATLAPAGDAAFDALVRRVESRYAVRRTRIPMFGLVNFFVKVSRPAGAKDLKLAIFEDFGTPGTDFHDLVAETLEPGWQPFVQVRSERETDSIYVQTGKHDLKMLITAAEPRETVLMQIKLDPKALRRWFEDPARMAKSRNNARPAIVTPVSR